MTYVGTTNILLLVRVQCTRTSICFSFDELVFTVLLVHYLRML